jgi:DivIVA domain-containing protein
MFDMKFKILERQLGEFPDLKDEYNRLIERGYKPYKCTVNESLVEDALVVELEVLLKDSIGKKICISQHKPIKDEEKLYTTDKDFIACTSNRLPIKLKLSQEEILNKEFRNSFMGYNSEEVDRFLDTIVEDYDEFEKNR